MTQLAANQPDSSQHPIARRSAYFPSLDGLRFIAASGVVVHHIEQILLESGLGLHWNTPFVRRIGPQAVKLFFVLSGYLITYLLLVERERTGTVSVSKFYVRRVLRIWPLYFAVVAAGLWLLPCLPSLAPPGAYAMLEANRWPVTAFFLLILPNVVLSAYGVVPHISVTWSIGVEEQFYLTWPLLMRAARRPVLMILCSFLVFPGIHFGLYFATRFLHVDLGSPLGRVAVAVAAQPFENMAIGGLAACAWFYGWKRYLAFVHSLPVQVAMLGTMVLLLGYSGPEIPLATACLPVLYAVLIQNLAGNPRSLLRLQWKWLRRFGQISYGVYMYHAFFVALAFHAVRAVKPEADVTTTRVFVYIVAFGSTLAVASLSYRWFEGPILRLKGKFGTVQSSALRQTD